MMISEVIRERRNKLALKEAYMSLLTRIAMLAVLGYLILTQVFLLTRATGSEMFPAVKDGDLIICFKLQQHYAKNDVVSYRVNGVRKLGRYTAQGGDVVTIDADGTLRINGTVQAGEIMYPTYAKDGLAYPYTVPANHVFILGDYRTQATDSRDFGAIPLHDVEGKVITLLRRRGL